MADRFLVWLCCGCDQCDPPDGQQRSRMPCNSPSEDGAWMVRADEHTAVESERDRLAGQNDGLYAAGRNGDPRLEPRGNRR